MLLSLCTNEETSLQFKKMFMKFNSGPYWRLWTTLHDSQIFNFLILKQLNKI
jgi:hypothetical protein